MTIAKTASCFQGGVRFPDGTLQTTAAIGGSGSVTSFSAGNIDSIATSSVATATTTPALTFSLVTQTANFVLAGPVSGGPSTPAFRALVAADIPSGTVPWNQIGNANGNLTLSNSGFTTEFDQTSAVPWLWKNTTVATVSTTNASPLLEVAANYWTGAASAADTWTLGSSLAAGANGISTLSIAHSGSSGTALVTVPFFRALGLVGGPSIAAMTWDVQFNHATTMSLATGFNIAWSSTTVSSGALDTNISRTGVASLAIGNGSPGDTTGNLSLNTIVKYGGVATVSQGVPAEYAKVDLTAQGAAITATLLYAVPAASSGMYRISWSAAVTTADGSASVLGGTTGFQIVYTDADDSVAKTSPRTITSGVNTDATNTTATALSGTIIVNAASSSNINYQMGYTSTTPGQMKYSLHLKLERL
jgi:hypothetical protein